MTIYDPFNTVNGVPQPFPGNIIPQNRMDPVALNLLKYMVEPNSQSRRLRQQLLPARELAVRHLHVRHHPHRSQLLDNHRFFVRYGHNGRRETRAKSGREEVARRPATTTAGTTCSAPT